MSYTRFSQTQKIVYEGNSTYGSWSKFRFLTEPLQSNQVGVYIVQPSTAGRPDLISNILYNTTQLDWVLLAYNNVRDPFNWPAVGTAIRYPVDSVVIREVYQ